MVESEFETNGLTMKLLGLARYCEGSRAAEIQAVIAQLPVAAYNERTAAEDEIARLRRENAALKNRLAGRYDLITPSSGARPQPSMQNGSGRPADAKGDWTHEDSRRQRDGRLSTSSSSSAIIKREPRRTSHEPSRHPSMTPPGRSRDLFQEYPSPKRQRMDSVLTTRRRPVCTGCFQVGGLCDGKVECDVCRARAYGCEYRECWDGLTCLDSSCTRIHPDQWDPVLEPGRKVNQSRNGGGSWR